MVQLTGGRTEQLPLDSCSLAVLIGPLGCPEALAALRLHGGTERHQEELEEKGD